MLGINLYPKRHVLIPLSRQGHTAVKKAAEGCTKESPSCAYFAAALGGLAKLVPLIGEGIATVKTMGGGGLVTVGAVMEVVVKNAEAILGHVALTPKSFEAVYIILTNLADPFATGAGLNTTHKTNLRLR